MRAASWSFAARGRRRASAVLLAIAVFFVALGARADKIADAEDLFRRAKALMAQGKYEEACPMLKESHRSDPAPGTLLNLALCHEQIGKTASAWAEFRVVEQQSRAATPPREDRMKLAREHAEKLEPRLSRIKLVISDVVRVPGLVIKVDGEEKGEALWAGGIVVDPGTRILEASAPHKKTATTKVKIDDEGVVQQVVLTPLDDAPDEPGPMASGSVEMAKVEEYAANRARRTAGYVVGGVGLVALAVGGAFGVAAIVNNNDAKSCSAPCYRDQPQGPASDQATDRALVFANVANVTVPLGVIGVAIGAYLVLTSGPTAHVKVAPRASAQGGGLDLAGTW